MKLLALLTILPTATSLTLSSPRPYNLTNDIQGSVRLNGLAFQQHALTTHFSHQYVALYTTAPTGYGTHHVSLGRRRVHPETTTWDFITLTDYTQTTLDEHNTISMGISGDGRIHLSFDHHDVPLNYRSSSVGLAGESPGEWSADAFGRVVHALPGSVGPWGPVTYPRFERVSGGDMLMEFRVGKSGAGDSWIHRYEVASGEWRSVGRYLMGEDNNAYVNGFSSVADKLFVSWTVRETPTPSTNHDFYFAMSEDGGESWKRSDGRVVQLPITPSTAGIRVFAIPQNSEIINQEGQCTDSRGRFHALMRDNSTGTPSFYHYLRTADGIFTKTAIKAPGLSPPPYLAYRGKLAALDDALLAILPDEPKQTVQIWGATAGANYSDWRRLGEIPNMAGEPLVDEERLARFGVLSLFVRQGGPFGERKIQVWDFGVEV